MTAKRGEKIEIQVRIVLYSACGVVLDFRVGNHTCVYLFFFFEICRARETHAVVEILNIRKKGKHFTSVFVY
jgi:hypothetical protein